MKRKRMKIALGIAIVLLVISNISLYGRYTVRHATAHDQIMIFIQMRNMAREGSIEEGIECLRYAHGYYPKGKPRIKSKLDRVVETCRKDFCMQIMQILREKTGKDYGNDPERWLSLTQEEIRDLTNRLPQ